MHPVLSLTEPSYGEHKTAVTPSCSPTSSRATFGGFLIKSRKAGQRCPGLLSLAVGDAGAGYEGEGPRNHSPALRPRRRGVVSPCLPRRGRRPAEGSATACSARRFLCDSAQESAGGWLWDDL
jgi:hypothetical protein